MLDAIMNRGAVGTVFCECFIKKEIPELGFIEGAEISEGINRGTN